MIYTANFDSPKELAEYLLKMSDEEYNKFYEWRKHDVSDKFVELCKNNFILPGKESWLCRTCEYYHYRFDKL
jgi:hypothetical protein